MNAERDIFDRPDESDADALAEADADAAAGRIVDNAEVAKWLAKWGPPTKRLHRLNGSNSLVVWPGARIYSGL